MVEGALIEITRLEAALVSSRETVDLLRAETNALRTALADPKDAVRRLCGALRRGSARSKAKASGDGAAARPYEGDPDYPRWVVENDSPTADDRHAMRRHIVTFDSFPLISVVMPVYNPNAAFFREALASVSRQIYPYWELCIADDASQSYVGDILRELAARDPRIKWIRRESNGHISAATNSALTLATGEFVALMDHDDVLPDHALYEVAAEINRYPDVDLIYSDEDHIDENGRRSEAYFKSDWNAELALGQNMVSHLGVYRRTLVERVGGLREGFEGSQDHDLALRIVDATERERIRHIPAVLYHWRQNSGENSFSEAFLERCAAASRKAVAEHLERRGITASVERIPANSGWQRVRRPIPLPAPLVSLIVPTKDHVELLSRCLEGLLHRTDYPNLEVLVVDHQSVEAAAHRAFEQLGSDRRVRILPYSGPFNFSAINNMAVSQSRGDIVGLVNNDIDVMSADWLGEMVSLAVRPEVGAVGAKLLYADEKIQHGGVLVGHDGVAGHFGHGAPRVGAGYFGRDELASEMSAVTAACMLVRKSLYEEVDGLDEINLPVAYNDVDFCLRLRSKGYVNIFTPFAELYHLESASRGPDTDPDKLDAFHAARAYMRRRWQAVIDLDPYYNPNLSLSDEPFSLAFPSRRVPPWRNCSASP